MVSVQRCASCGAKRVADVDICLECETPFPPGAPIEQPARPAAPSPTQSHGTVMLGLLAGFVVLGFLLYLSIRDVGPFDARVVSTGERVGDRIPVTIEVTNTGGKAGHGKCSIGRVYGPTDDLRSPYQFLSNRVPGDSTITQTVEVPVEEGVTVSREIRC